MTIRVLAAALLCLWAAVAAAQDRPPEPPRSFDPHLAGDRPREKPARPEATAGDAAPTPETGPAHEGFGPPPPPRWWVLRETDQDYAACRLALSLLGTVYAEEPAVTEADNRDCGIARPIRVTRVLPEVALEGGALMRCDTARALAFWSRDFLLPAAATLPGAPRVTGLRLGTGYDCRDRIGADSAAPLLSEHALGNAIDISAVLLDRGEPIPIAPRAESGDRIEAFQRAIRGAACLFFTTVLGPGANVAHDDHLHLDLAARRGDWRLCR